MEKSYSHDWFMLQIICNLTCLGLYGHNIMKSGVEQFVDFIDHVYIPSLYKVHNLFSRTAHLFINEILRQLLPRSPSLRCEATIWGQFRVLN